MARPGPQVRPAITTAERTFLKKLDEYGAFTLAEAQKAGLTPAEVGSLQKRQLIGKFMVAQGVYTVLLAQGRVALYGSASGSMSPEGCVDRAYLRLALQELGWPTPQDRLNLKQWYPKSQAVEVLTPDGPALVFASIRGGGYTSAGIKKICLRLGSLALSRNFWIVILTSSAQRGQEQARRHPAFLKVIPVVPRSIQNFSSQPRVPPSNVLRLEEPYFNQRLAQEARRSSALPERSIEILQLSRTERIAHADAALACDRILTQNQLQRHYGLQLDDLPAQLLRVIVVRPCHARDAEDQSVPCLVKTMRLYNAPAHRLAHLAGLAEIRRLLGVEPDPEIWQVEARGRLRYEEPDAYWHSPEGLIAIEFDNGSYSRRIIECKLTTFEDRDFVRTIWGATSASRVRYMSQFPGLETRLVEWWR